QDDDRGACALEHEGRGGSGDPDDLGALGKRRLLADAFGEVRIGPAQPPGDRARDAFDLGLERGLDDQFPARGPREQLDGAVVMGRAEPAGDDAQVRLEARPQRRFELDRVVPDDLYARRLDAEPQELCREKRPVAVAALAADELATGDDDDAARACQAVAGATETPRRVTTTLTVRPPPGMVTALPLTLALRPPGLPKLIQRRRAVKRRFLWRSSVPVKSAGPLAE